MLVKFPSLSSFHVCRYIPGLREDVKYFLGTLEIDVILTSPSPQTLGQQKLKNKILPPHLCAMILLLLRKTRLNYCSLRLTFTEELPQTIWARVLKSPPPSPYFGQCPNKANIFHDKFQFFLYISTLGGNHNQDVLFHLAISSPAFLHEYQVSCLSVFPST